VYGDYGGEKKCNQFSVHEKRTIAEIDRGIKKGSVARKHGLSTSSQMNFLQGRQKIRMVDYNAV
jgi:hypothetical protein